MRKISALALEWLPQFVTVPPERVEEDLLAAYLLAFNIAWNAQVGIAPNPGMEMLAETMWSGILFDDPSVLGDLIEPGYRGLANAIHRHKQRHAPDDTRVIIRCGVLPTDDPQEIRAVADFVEKDRFDPTYDYSMDIEQRLRLAGR
jgi:hypothetical protein